VEQAFQPAETGRLKVRPTSSKSNETHPVDLFPNKVTGIFAAISGIITAKKSLSVRSSSAGCLVFA
jgi:hypothetical protein